jgi:hypothetical protein
MPSNEPFRPWLFVPEIVYPYDPRLRPVPPPDTGIFDCPQVQVCINSKWISHLDGLIERLLFRDAWLADETEIDRATGEIAKLLSVLKVDNMSCCCGNTFPTRINENGELEISYDGGITWVPYPQGDPRQNVTLLPPLPGADGDDKKCTAANSAVAYLIQIQQDQVVKRQLNTNIAELAAALIAFLVAIGIIATGGALAVFLAAIGAIAMNLSAEDFDNAFTETVWDNLLCTLFCNMGSDATFTDNQWQAVINDIEADNSGTAESWLVGMIKAMGAKGLQNAARLGLVGTRLCTSCDCGLDLIYVFAATENNEITPGVVTFQGGSTWTLESGVWSVIATGDHFAAVGVKDAQDRCFKITSIDVTNGSYGQTFRNLCAGGGGIGEVLDVCILVATFDARPPANDETPFTVSITAELC